MTRVVQEMTSRRSAVATATLSLHHEGRREAPQHHGGIAGIAGLAENCSVGGQHYRVGCDDHLIALR